MAGASPASGERLARRRLSDEAAERIQAWIRAGAVEPGGLLPSERELCARFGVGRTTVREALQRLDQMGLVAVSQGGRARVIQPTAEGLIAQISGSARQMLAGSPASLAALKETRLLLETAVVRLAAARVDAAGTARLVARHRALEACVEAPGGPMRMDRFLAADMAFHVELAACTGNEILVAVTRATCAFLAEFHIDLVRLPGAERLTLAEHAEILAAVSAHEVEAAERAMRAHLTRANPLYRPLERGGQGPCAREADAAQQDGTRAPPGA
jgi:DNA-binding FadR family transcriptional regulator